MKYWRRFIVEDTRNGEGPVLTRMNDLVMMDARQGLMAGR
jgi:hypothetical protein